MKKTISEMIHCYIEKHNEEPEKMKELTCFLEDFFNKEGHEKVKEHFYDELEDFTEELDETIIHEAAEHLRRKDGTLSGVHWSMDEAEALCKQYDAKMKMENIGKRYDLTKFWFSINYVYAVHFSSNRTTNGYVDLAIDEIGNKNVCFDDLIRKIFEKE